MSSSARSVHCKCSAELIELLHRFLQCPAVSPACTVPTCSGFSLLQILQKNIYSWQNWENLFARYEQTILVSGRAGCQFTCIDPDKLNGGLFLRWNWRKCRGKCSGFAVLLCTTLCRAVCQEKCLCCLSLARNVSSARMCFSIHSMCFHERSFWPGAACDSSTFCQSIWWSTGGQSHGLIGFASCAKSAQNARSPY